VKVGVPFTVIVAIVSVLLVPIFPSVPLKLGSQPPNSCGNDLCLGPVSMLK
jgi:hypothetical protein